MSSKRAILVVAFALLAVVPWVWGIKCWVCRSDNDPKCSDPFDNTTVPIFDCSKETPLLHLPSVKSTMCRKVRQKVNGVWRYIRSCAFLGEPGIEGDERFCLMRTGTYNIFIEYCTCNSKDGCNSAPSAKLESNLLLPLTLLVSALPSLYRRFF